MGWWGYLLFSPDVFYATTPQECEYMASRAVGWGASPAFETQVRCLHWRVSHQRTRHHL